ncbi:hypothetical protein DFR86_06960 [Acidianus sulfidivorans JP7]|uniref:Metallophosphoesterase TT1561-like domain-containing protein n=1 Tax=Acidianus sulfidivorans JP7 TaxID=619593 RepID=A0A2U9IQL7_9CREN|nr:hypothetical protein DFR86_06960 [Acidianus sulfidivorans JP7]
MIIGLGDVECPQYLNNYYGILGEMESVYIQKYLKKQNRLITRYLDFSTDFSTDFYLTHFPPKGFNSGITYNVNIGRSEVAAMILEHKPKVVLHGHSEEQRIVEKMGIKIISVGSFYLGYYAEYNEETKEIILKRRCH